MKFTKSTKGLVLITIIISLIISIATSSQIVAIVIPIAMFSNEYKKRNLQINNLVRLAITTGGSSIILVPWSIPTIYVANVLNMQAEKFIPYLFFPIVVGIISTIYAFTGFTMTELEENEYLENSIEMDI